MDEIFRPDSSFVLWTLIVNSKLLKRHSKAKRRAPACESSIKWKSCIAEHEDDAEPDLFESDPSSDSAEEPVILGVNNVFVKRFNCFYFFNKNMFYGFYS